MVVRFKPFGRYVSFESFTFSFRIQCLILLCDIVCRQVFSEYSETSTVHGVRYLGEKRRHWSERIWWIVTVSISVFLCAGFIIQAWWKWNTTPVIISFAEEATPISKIPFPTITICNDLMVNSSVLNYSSIRDQLSKEEFTNADFDFETIQRVHSLTNFCNYPPYYLGEYIDYKNYSIDRNIMPYLKEVAPKLFKDADRCNLAAEQKFECELLFTQILTDAGLCYTFNQMGSDEIYNVNLLADDFPKVHGFKVSYWHLKDYNLNGPQVHETISFPYKMLNAGKGLELRMLVPKTENDYLCSDLLEGFKIWIHSGEEIPRLKKHFYHIPFDHDVRIAVRPNLMMTSPGLVKNYSQKQRKCIGENEHDLIFFKKYTQRNCQLDILANLTKTICGCVLFWMPRFNETGVCSFWKEFNCVEHVENLLSLDNASFTQKCLPVCDSITYDAEISISNIEVKALRKFVPDGFKIIKMSVIFKDQQYYASIRSELYGLLDFIGSCGGILSLFMGISLLSVVEIIYFATLRLTCNLRKRNLAKKRILAQQNILNGQNE